MTLITAVAFLLAVRLNAMVVAVLGIAGGFLTRVLLSTGEDYPLGLFVYIGCSTSVCSRLHNGNDGMRSRFWVRSDSLNGSSPGVTTFFVRKNISRQQGARCHGSVCRISGAVFSRR